jgi:hypothetical protein
LWSEACPGSDVRAQKIKPVDQRNIGQLCKYPLKLPPLVTVDIIREAARTLADRKTLVGFGAWRAFLKEGRYLRDLHAPKRPALHLADQRISALAKRDGVLSFTKYQGGLVNVKQRDIREIRDAILLDPRTFLERDRFDRQLAAAKMENKKRVANNMPQLDLPEMPPIDHLRRKWWDRFAPPPTGPPPAKPQPTQLETRPCQTELRPTF